MEKFVPAVVAAFALGIVVGGISGIDFGGGIAPTDSGPDSDSPPYWTSTSGSDCLDVRPHAGWVHEVATGESFAVTLNATVVHDRNSTVEANVTRAGPGRYRIDLRTVPRSESSTDSQKRPPDDCRIGTDVRVGTNLPTDYRKFEVTVNSRTLLTVENEDTAPDLYQLPNPVNASQ